MYLHRSGHVRDRQTDWQTGEDEERRDGEPRQSDKPEQAPQPPAARNQLPPCPPTHPHPRTPPHPGGCLLFPHPLNKAWPPPPPTPHPQNPPPLSPPTPIAPCPPPTHPPPIQHCCSNKPAPLPKFHYIWAQASFTLRVFIPFKNTETEFIRVHPATCEILSLSGEHNVQNNHCICKQKWNEMQVLLETEMYKKNGKS